MSTTRLVFLTLLICVSVAQAQTPQKWSERMAATLMLQHDEGLVYDKTKPERWNYKLGVMLVDIEQIWHKTGDAKYFNYI